MVFLIEFAIQYLRFKNVPSSYMLIAFLHYIQAVSCYKVKFIINDFLYSGNVFSYLYEKFPECYVYVKSM